MKGSLELLGVFCSLINLQFLKFVCVYLPMKYFTYFKKYFQYITKEQFEIIPVNVILLAQS